MEEVYESRFNPDFARDLLLEIAQERSLDNLLQTIIRRLVERPSVAAARIWLLDKGDVCGTCVRRPDCPDQTRCLHAVAGGGRSIADPPIDYVRMNDKLARVPLGTGII